MVKNTQWRSSFVWTVFQLLLLIAESSAEGSSPLSKIWRHEPNESPPVQLHIVDHEHIMVDNGIINVTFSITEGAVTGLEYNGINNLLESENEEDNRGYWDVVYTRPERPGDVFDKLGRTHFEVIVQNEDQVELSFSRTWDNSNSKETGLPLNIDKRYIMLRGCRGFYSYAIFERLEGWPAVTLYEGRIVFKLQERLFRFMAISDEKQRIMPTAEDFVTGKALDYKEAVLLTDPSNPFLKGEVDDKYQYSSDNEDSRVHGWISWNPPTGFWMITPSNEFKTAGPVKQDLTSHTGPTTLSMFFSTHYAGESLGIKFEDGEPWKKVFGPVFIYVNSVSRSQDPKLLWKDAKKQMIIESGKWPYEFPVSEDHLRADQRGNVNGQLLVHDRYSSERVINANSAFVGLAPPGLAGSWQTENKGYQFWARTDSRGYFSIPGIRPGNYSLYAWVPGFIGDYKYDADLNISPGSIVKLGALTYYPPRSGPTLWEIGIPDRTAAEFYIPPPSPTLMNKLYIDLPEKYRQYGLWQRYSELYPEQDLVYTVGLNNHPIDWFFAHVNRNIGNNTYVPTTWKIIFNLDSTESNGNYTLQLALASATGAELQVRVNDGEATTPHFTTGLIGRDNAIARHGIHGLYWLYSVEILPSQLSSGSNTIFLRQSRGESPWRGIMYDYVRLEASEGLAETMYMDFKPSEGVATKLCMVLVVVAYVISTLCIL